MENFGNNKWNSLFSPVDETNVRIIWRKMISHPGMKVSTRGQLAGMQFHPEMKYLVFYM